MALLEWPGKTYDAGQFALRFHPAAYHMLDVAAVAEHLIAPFSFAVPVRDALVLLVTLHDLGKISQTFRSLLEAGTSQPFRHWELSEISLYACDSLLADHLGATPQVRQALYAAVAGHHGRPSQLVIGGVPVPPRPSAAFRKAAACVGTGAPAAEELVQAVCALWPDASLESLSEQQATDLSWWLPGFCTAADWIGSNSGWFPPQPAIRGLADYLVSARQRAQKAVAKAGLMPPKPVNTALFDFALRPMQQACATVALTEGPMLAVIEDETGAGKTEAALLLAQRMLCAGKGRGIFFALPTMATADAMFRRAADVVGSLFDHPPTVTLAHGRSGLSVEFHDVIVGASRSEDSPICTEWLAESRRRALLADVGVGTIDQALLAVLPVKFQTLRAFGLSSKILIVDEVHELGEPYIGAELEALLKLHRAAGGSAILLTATLPLKQRERLLAIYGGQGADRAYPALSVARGEHRADFPQQTGAKGVVGVDRIARMGDAVTLLVEKSRQGAACVWVRNAVDDAIAAVQALRDQGIAAQVLHARFTLWDRKRIEREVTRRVGKGGSGRQGFVLVGTQVLESSLDFDFDVMVSDLAPMAALIQRVGRLWRHMGDHPAGDRPVDRPLLSLLCPDPDQVSDDTWLQGTLDRGAYVYPLADQWRTARVLLREGEIKAPSRLRALIEAVHGEAADPLPEPLLAADAEAEGKGMAQRSHARQNIVAFEDGYRMAGNANADADYPTRLGEPQRTLVLARQVAGRLVPWADEEGAQGWALSEVSARMTRLDALPLPDQGNAEIRAVTKDWPDWKVGAVRVCPVGDDGEICPGLRYSADFGLMFVSSS